MAIPNSFSDQYNSMQNPYLQDEAMRQKLMFMQMQAKQSQAAPPIPAAIPEPNPVLLLLE